MADRRALRHGAATESGHQLGERIRLVVSLLTLLLGLLGVLERLGQILDHHHLAHVLLLQPLLVVGAGKDVAGPMSGWDVVYKLVMQNRDSP